MNKWFASCGNVKLFELHKKSGVATLMSAVETPVQFLKTTVPSSGTMYPGSSTYISFIIFLISWYETPQL